MEIGDMCPPPSPLLLHFKADNSIFTLSAELTRLPWLADTVVEAVHLRLCDQIAAMSFSHLPTFSFLQNWPPSHRGHVSQERQRKFSASVSSFSHQSFSIERPPKAAPAEKRKGVGPNLQLRAPDELGSKANLSQHLVLIAANQMLWEAHKQGMGATTLSPQVIPSLRYSGIASDIGGSNRSQ